MRLIDADLLKLEIACVYGSNPQYINWLNHAPTVDAVPVRHGKWIDEGQYADFFPHHAWRCSECGEHVIEIDTPWYKYCPNCGTRMDEERDSDHAEEEIL